MQLSILSNYNVLCIDMKRTYIRLTKFKMISKKVENLDEED